MKRSRAKWYLVIAVVILVSVLANAAITAFTLGVSSTGDLTGCNQTVTTSGICLAAPTAGGILVGAWVNGGAIVQIYPSSGTVPSQLAITCPTVTIGATGLVVPTTSPCTITLLK